MKKSIIGIILLIVILSLSLSAYAWPMPKKTFNPICTTAVVETPEVTPDITETSVITIEPTPEITAEITEETTPDFTTTIEPTTTAVPSEEEEFPNTGESNPLIFLVFGMAIILSGVFVAIRMRLQKQK